MVVRKYLHSCIVIEEDGKRLLVDPGVFSFDAGKVVPEDVGPVDVIVLTHPHQDHYFSEAIKKIVALRPAEIVTHDEIGALLEKEGLKFMRVVGGETISVGGFTLQAFTAPHGPLPIPLPHNLAYLINNRFLHPGDSYEVAGLSSAEIVALPVAGPWLRLRDGLEFAKTLHPKHVIPIHDAIIQDFFIERIYTMSRDYLAQEGIALHPLKPGETFEV